ncbi:FGGY carbohydrate kinase domain-containing protein-like isoform X2 [Gigantopelta aegis]|nr:FGGY carbohydrate kinase domain-containing protein-like isoform X2 [Gigantopelta aegis]
MWMDHRAAEQASVINSTKHDVLQYVGGKMSLEMEPPKLLWLKQNLKDHCWDKAEQFFDLPDFLTWKATGSMSRSQCSLVCKCGYTATSKEHGWDDSFMTSIGLQDLIENEYVKIGQEVRKPGEPCGNGLSEEAAAELGLLPATPVSTSIIDAHAGAIGCLGCQPTHLSVEGSEVTGHLVLICGTSTCHMVLSAQPVFVPGVWGPYYSTMIPGYWNNEGGQSATGKLIDFVVENHSAFTEASELASKRGMHIHDYLNYVLNNMAVSRGRQSVSELTEDLHVWPDYHGNRSPLADPTLKGMVCGLTLLASVESLALLYLATVQALAYGTRHILDKMNDSGHKISAVYICGGLRKNELFVKTNADVIGLPIILPDTSETVLLGSAILGACASHTFASTEEALKQMGGQGTAISPNDYVKRFHDKKYKVFLKMLEHQKEYQTIMAST